MRTIDADALTASLKESADRCRDWIQECINIKDDVTQMLAEQSLLTINECYLRIKKMPTVEPQKLNGRWIPVTERLPDEDGVYLVTDNYGEVVRYVFHMSESSREFWYRNVVAWMPQPEPYKGGQE